MSKSLTWRLFGLIALIQTMEVVDMVTLSSFDSIQDTTVLGSQFFGYYNYSFLSLNVISKVKLVVNMLAHVLMNSVE